MTPVFELRELTSDDADAYYALLDANRAHLSQRGDYADEAAATPEWARAQLSLPWAPSLRFGVWLGDALIGRVDLIAVDPPRYSVGYWLDAARTGRGIATAAVGRLLDIAAGLGATEVYAGITHGNDASVGLVRRLGFEQVADFDRYTRFRFTVPG